MQSESSLELVYDPFKKPSIKPGFNLDYELIIANQMIEDMSADRPINWEKLKKKLDDWNSYRIVWDAHRNPLIRHGNFSLIET